MFALVLVALGHQNKADSNVKALNSLTTDLRATNAEFEEQLSKMAKNEYEL